MRVPNRLQPLLDQGVIEEVLRPLMSGKEAEIYLVVAGGEECVAKVYKDAQSRSFQHRAQYTEGRRVRSSREQRAMQKGSRYGRAQTEDAWSAAEVGAIYRLRAAGVRVPEPYAFIEGVLVMELIKDSEGEPAPRLVDRHFEPADATELFHVLLREVVKMLCAGVIHADLSDFNVLLSADGPVIIDFPQVVDPAGNQNARKLLLRDVKNLTDFLSRFAPELRKTRYGLEIWSLYERSELDPQTPLTGRHDPKKESTNVSSLLEDILAIEQEVRERREALGLPPPGPARRPVFVERPAPKAAPKKAGAGRGASARGGAEPKEEQQPDPSSTPKKRRRRRRKRSAEPDSNGSAQGGVQQTASASPRSPSPETDSLTARPRRRRRRRRRRGSGGGPPPTSGSAS